MKQILLEIAFLVVCLSKCTQQKQINLKRYIDCPVLKNGPCQCEETGDLFSTKKLICQDFNSSQELLDDLNQLRGLRFDYIFIRNGSLKAYPPRLFKDIETSLLYITRVEVDETLDFSKEGFTNTVEGIYLDSVTGLDRLQNDWSKAFGHLWFLHQFHIKHSPMKRLPITFNRVGLQGTNINSIYLKNNSIECADDLALASFSKAIEIDLSYNDMARITRKMLPILYKQEANQTALQLRVLNLQNNRITYLSQDLLEDFPHLRTVMLDKNSLITIQERLVLRSPSSYLLVNLEKNPIQCDCALRWIIDKEATLRVTGRCRGIYYKTMTETLRHITC